MDENYVKFGKGVYGGMWMMSADKSHINIVNLIWPPNVILKRRPFSSTLKYAMHTDFPLFGEWVHGNIKNHLR